MKTQGIIIRILAILNLENLLKKSNQNSRIVVVKDIIISIETAYKVKIASTKITNIPLRIYCTPRSSVSKIKVAFGGITPG